MKILKKFHAGEVLRMLSFMEKRKYPYIIALIGGTICRALYNVIIAFINKTMINASIKKDISVLPEVLLISSIALFLACVINPVFRYIFNKSIKECVNDIRQKMFKHMECLPVDFFEKHHSGDTVSRLTNDVNAIETAYGENMWDTISTALVGVSSAVSMVVLNWKLAIFMICLSIVSTKTNFKLVLPIRKINDEIQSCKSKATEFISDMVSGFRVIKMFDLVCISDKYLNENKEIADNSMKRVKKLSELISVNHIISTCSFVGVFIIGSLMVYNNSADFGSVTAILSLQNGVTYALSECGQFFADLMESLAGADRVFQLLDEKKEQTRINIGGKCDEDNMIDIKHLSFKYDTDKKILNNVNISVKRGESVALVGESGGGKSTITKLLLGFYPIKQGEICINNKPLFSYTLKELRNLIAYVPQDAFLFDGTIKENIMYGNESASKEQIIKAAKMANAHDFIIEMKDGYDTCVGEKGSNLSGGQRQRIAIARALIKDAPILLLDEATSALDTESEMLVQKALNVLMKGRTSIVIAHRLSTIKKCSKIYVLESGFIKEQGNHQELLDKKGMYYNLCKLTAN